MDENGYIRTEKVPRPASLVCLPPGTCKIRHTARPSPPRALAAWPPWMPNVSWNRTATERCRRCRCAIVHYHELALKGRNRDYFEQRLIRNIQLALKDLGAKRVESLRSRIRVVLPPSATDEIVKARLAHVFGIANFSLAHALPLNLATPDWDVLKQAVGQEVQNQSFATFRVSAKRADKRLGPTSMDVEKDIGSVPLYAHGEKGRSH